MLKVTKTEPLQRIDRGAVSWYQYYFEQLLNQNTFRIRLTNDQLYYHFSEKDFETWKRTLYDESFVQATRYLDKIDMEQISVMSVKSVEDISPEVKKQYHEQSRIIFDSLSYVERIMEYRENPLVRKSIDMVLRSRQNDESKRKYWRALNEKYFGLDIHPLMEYEIEELQGLLDYCMYPDQYSSTNKSVQYLTAGTVVAGGVMIGYILLKLLK